MKVFLPLGLDQFSGSHNQAGDSILSVSTLGAFLVEL